MTEPEDELLTLDEQLDRQLDPNTRDIEAPAADAAEQAMPANPADEPVNTRGPAFEVNEYDALEQERIVELDDDYR
jgi:hypothetical protein